MAILTLLTIVGFYKTNFLCLLGIPLIFMTICGFLAPMGKSKTDTVLAKITRVGNEFVIQSAFPTLLVSDMKYLDARVTVTRTIKHTVWGYETSDNPTYQVGIILDSPDKITITPEK